jgi:hypothetical protein
MDTPKHFFRLQGVNAAAKVVLRKKLRSAMPKRKLENSKQRLAPARLTHGNVADYARPVTPANSRENRLSRKAQN